jgi:hypothetical protein
MRRFYTLEEEVNYAELSSRITHLNSAIEEAEQKLQRYAFLHPLKENDVRAESIRLQAELEELQVQRQRLLPGVGRFESADVRLGRVKQKRG